MYTDAKQELQEMRSEMQSIIDELRNISGGVRSDFSGIGNDRCADTIAAVADQYEQVKRQLNKIDAMDIMMNGSIAYDGGFTGGGGAGRRF